MGMAICIIVGTTKYWGIFILDWRQYFISKRSLPTSWLKAGRQLILVLTAAAVFLEKRLNKGLWSECISVPKYLPNCFSSYYFLVSFFVFNNVFCILFVV